MRTASAPAAGAVTAVAVVALATVGGLVTAMILRAAGADLGFTLSTSSSWLTGLALLGQWERSVTTTVPIDGSFVESLRLVPFTSTAAALAVGVWTSARFRSAARGATSVAIGAASATVVGALCGLGLALTTRSTVAEQSDAGSVEVVRALHPGWTALGAGALAAGAYLWGQADPRGAAGRGWRDARAVIVIPGLVLSVLISVYAAVQLLPGSAVPVTVATLFPLLGSAAMLVASGAPLEADLSLITAEPVSVWVPVDRTLLWLGALLVAGLLAFVAGTVRGRREPRAGNRALALTAVWCAAVAVGVVAVTRVTGTSPDGLGGDVVLHVGAPGAAAVGAALGLVVGLVAERASHVVEHAGRLARRAGRVVQRAGRAGQRVGGGGQRAGRHSTNGSGERASGKTSAMTMTSPDSGSD